MPYNSATIVMNKLLKKLPKKIIKKIFKKLFKLIGNFFLLCYTKLNKRGKICYQIY